MHSDLFGAVIAFLAAILSITGTNTQKRSHLIDEKLPKHERKSYLQRPLWWIGFLSVVGASIGDFAALGIADQGKKKKANDKHSFLARNDEKRDDNTHTHNHSQHWSHR